MTQLVKVKATGKLGIVGCDPYQICGDGEIIVSFSRATDPDPNIGNGFALDDLVFVTPDQVSRYSRRKYNVLNTAELAVENEKRKKAEWKREIEHRVHESFQP